MNNNNIIRNKNQNNKGKKKKKNNTSLSKSVSAPAASSKQAKTKTIQIIKSGPNSYRFRKSEFLVGVTTNTTFTNAIARLEVNPGLSATFPWLSQIAQQWEEYRFHNIEFEYVTRAATSQAGNILIAPDYDCSDPTPTTELILSSYEDAVEDALWKDITCRLNNKSMFPNGERKFVRSGPVVGSLKLYDVAQLFYAPIASSAIDVGRLWVHYDVEFFVASNDSGGGSRNSSVSFFQNQSSQSITTATAVIVDVAGNGTWIENPLNVTFSEGVFTPLPGTYLMTVYGCLASSAATSWVAVLAILKNSGEMDPVCETYQQGTVTSSNNQRAFSMSAVVSASGTDTFHTTVDLTAGGTLTVQADTYKVFFQVI